MLRRYFKAALTGVVALGACAGAARADTTTIATAGYWKTFGGTTQNGTSICGIATYMNKIKASFYIKHYGTDDHIVVELYKDSWSIPDGTKADLRIQIDELDPWKGTSVGDDTRLSLMIKASAGTFLEEIRLGNAIRISFPNGSEPDWRLSLAGTGQVLTSFALCYSNQMNTGGATQPFGSPNTQPFSRPPAPTQPFSGTGRRG